MKNFLTLSLVVLLSMTLMTACRKSDPNDTSSTTTASTTKATTTVTTTKPTTTIMPTLPTDTLDSTGPSVTGKMKMPNMR